LAAAKGIKWLDGADFLMDKQTPAECLTCGYQWQAWPQSVKAGNGCPRCSGKATTAEDWEERAAKSNLKWLEPVQTSDTKTKAKCLNCDFIWNVKPSSVARGTGCPKCADYGFDPLAPAHIYLLDRDDGVAQIGITKDMKTRLGRHELNGYRLVAKWDFATGLQARNIEQAIINQWRTEDDLLPAAVEGEDGWTETVHTDSMPIETIIQRINALIKQR
jgi:predicted Zn-ribbon and HTH transcriptional regulator